MYDKYCLKDALSIHVGKVRMLLSRFIMDKIFGYAFVRCLRSICKEEESENKRVIDLDCLMLGFGGNKW